MNIYFDYPIHLEKSTEGFLVTFPNFPEAITQGETFEEALLEAADCLEEAIANRIAMKLEIPAPTLAKKDQHLVSLHATIAAKAALYIAMKEEKLNNSTLAKKLDFDEKEVRRLLDPYYASKLPRIEFALSKLGRRLAIGIARQ